MVPSLQVSAKPYVVVKQPDQEYMIARALDSPQSLPPGSPLVIHAISVRTGMRAICQASSTAASSRDSTAPSHHHGYSVHQRALNVQQPDSPNEADAALPDLLSTSSVGTTQSVQEPSVDDSSRQHAHETMAATAVPEGMVNEPSRSTFSLPASQQHTTLGSLPLAVEACRSGSSASSCKTCSSSMPLLGHEGDTKSADTRDEQVACNVSEQGLSSCTRSSLHPLSAMKARPAFLTDTKDMLMLKANISESSITWTPASMQDKKARQHCSDSSSCSRSACPASSDGLGTGEAFDIGQQPMDATCCAEPDAKPPSRETSSSNEAWHACHDLIGAIGSAA